MRFLKLKEKIIRNRPELIFSLFISFFLIIAGYFANNWPLFTGEDLDSYAMGAYSKHVLSRGNDGVKFDSVVFINTAFDKDLADVYDDDDINNSYLGNTDITNRKTLLRFLEMLDSVDYKYLIIDIRFAKGLCSKDPNIDRMLFDRIYQMDKCIVAADKRTELIEDSLDSKSGLTNYWSTITSTNFVRYQYFEDKEYLPLRVYNDLMNRGSLSTIKHWHPFGTDGIGRYFGIFWQGGHLCQNSIFLQFEFADRNGKLLFDEDAHFGCLLYQDRYLEMGKRYANVKDSIKDERINGMKSYFKDKYIIIGNTKEDIHDTYAGPQPGPVILFNAIHALEHNKHIVYYWQLILLFILYFSINFCILKDISITSLFKIEEPITKFLVGFLTFSSVIFIFHFLEWIFGFSSYSFLIPIIVFSVIKFVKGHFYTIS